ncbi:Oxidoreductase family, NAD-binding Rossmann fold [Micromonospora peucetia]|nr:Oxidoreductase family, NAD-binding Rossmann fold [Micromonospora peucetia]
MKRNGVPVRVTGIVDPVEPVPTALRPAGRELVAADRPEWIDTVGRSDAEVVGALDRHVAENGCDAVLVASGPAHHETYSRWGLQRGINVLCDKPPVLMPDASWDREQAAAIWTTFDEHLALERAAVRERADYLFGTPLRRRALTPFLSIATHLDEVHRRTGEGITFLNAIVNGGLHRFPIEFLKGGAHGYLEGVGGLAHSSYHYVDTLGWYLQMARGRAAKLRVSLSYVNRVRDYLAGRRYQQLMELTGERDLALEDVELPARTLACELDFSFVVQVLDAQNVPIGVITYTSNHSTYAPRENGYEKEVLNPANEKSGGRMSQVYLDIHQGMMQNWQLIKNDRVFYGDSITTIRRQHPSLGEEYRKTEYSNAYEEQTITPRQLTQSFILASGGYEVDALHLSHFATLQEQRLAMRLFSAFYELIAEEYQSGPGIVPPAKTLLLDELISPLP